MSDSNSKVPPELQGHEWKPGQSGNPAGRPKGRKRLEHEVAQLLELAGSDPDKTRMESWAKALVDEIEGNPTGKAAELLIAREWPVTAKHELSTPPDNPVTIKIDHAAQAEKAAKAIEILGDVIKPSAE